jgi:hypothetical protein
VHSFGFFVSILLQNQAFDESENKKAGYFVPGFFLVDKKFELSNLFKDITEIIKLFEVLI